MFQCMECGKKFRTIVAARRAVNNGCSGCGGSDIDLDMDPTHVCKTDTPVRKQSYDGYYGEERDPLRPSVGRCRHGVPNDTVCPDCTIASSPHIVGI
jgi:predicted  nucleic acid-binding Zn-ribbon protein